MRRPTLHAHHLYGRQNCELCIGIPKPVHAAMHAEWWREWPRATRNNTDHSPLLFTAAVLRAGSDWVQNCIDQLSEVEDVLNGVAWSVLASAMSLFPHLPSPPYPDPTRWPAMQAQAMVELGARLRSPLASNSQLTLAFGQVFLDEYITPATAWLETVDEFARDRFGANVWTEFRRDGPGELTLDTLTARLADALAYLETRLGMSITEGLIQWITQNPHRASLMPIICR